MKTTITVPVTCDDLLAQTALMAKEGYRLVQICALVPYSLEHMVQTKGDSPIKNLPVQSARVPLPEFELYYSFDNDYQLINLKLNVSREQEIPSISRNFFAAFLYENEINEQFGTKITKIALDFKGTLYKKAKEAPYDIYARKGDAK